MSSGTSLTYRRMKTEAKVREAKAKADAERKKGILVLILAHLADQGYTRTCAALEDEAALSTATHVAADNVNLIDIVADYEAYYDIRFSRKPKLFRRRDASDAAPSASTSASASRPHRSRRAQTAAPASSSRAQARRERAAAAADAYKPPPGVESTALRRALDSGSRFAAPASRPGSAAAQGASAQPPAQAQPPSAVLSVAGASTALRPPTAPPSAAHPPPDELASPSKFFDNRLLKPLPIDAFGWTGELAELAHTITRDIFTENPNVAFSDIAGLDAAKQILREAMVAPIKYPQLFTGILQPWKGLLLFGPPGTGKTMLAKAVATQCKTTFFNISASSIVSKWRGDSEKLVRVLFDLARYHAPSTIFLDEIDAIMSRRGGGPGGEHEGSRRLKTELLIQMDGLARAADDLVFVLAASNLPWELDPAFLRRLEKRILVDLPSAPARTAMFAANLPPDRAPGLDHAALAAATEGYSGSDIFLVSKEAAMKPLRRLMTKLDLDSLDDTGADEAPVVLGPVTTDDALDALASTRPSTAGSLAARYSKWQSEHGAE